MENSSIKLEKIRLLTTLERDYPEGASLAELVNTAQIALPKRTLQRRLADLLKEKKLFAIGHGCNLRYHIFRIIPQLEEPDSSPMNYPPVTREAETILKAVRVPLESRQPVSYHYEFLQKYQPNKTFYLTENIRKLLKKIGAPSNDKQESTGTYLRKIFHRLLIDLSWNSSRLEGNTYSLPRTSFRI